MKIMAGGIRTTIATDSKINASEIVNALEAGRTLQGNENLDFVIDILSKQKEVDIMVDFNYGKIGILYDGNSEIIISSILKLHPLMNAKITFIELLRLVILNKVCEIRCNRREISEVFEMIAAYEQSQKPVGFHPLYDGYFDGATRNGN